MTTPDYVRTIARRAGVPVDAHRVALAVPSDYSSRKAVLFLFPGDEPEPELVVKISRARDQNARLENEWRALTWLRESGVEGTLPRPAFFGTATGLAVLGESAVAGVEFLRRTTARPDCPLAHGALQWLLELGEVTAHETPDNSHVACALDDLATRFEALYHLTDAQRARLHRHIDTFLTVSRPLPLVFQHGDPGAWNLLVTNDGRPAFLDWEAAEPDGMPLWDVFYFARSYAVTVARALGATSALGAVRQQLLGDRPVNRLLVAAVEDHCSRIGLERELVEPLFVSCWMHRALKEATRLRPVRLDAGHYAALVRLSLDQADAPGLRRLFGWG